MTSKPIKSDAPDVQMAAGKDALTAVALSLMLLTLWAVTHRFHGLSRDGELYAFQAMARIDPSLRADLYLQNASQDQYTLFSPLYAGFISLFGLLNAEVLLFVTCAVALFAAAWKLIRLLSNATMAWLSVAMLTITTGYYGGSNIFSYAEPYLTARSLAEALSGIALAVHFAGRRVIALSIAVTAMFVHPLMALPALLLLISLQIRLRVAIGGAVLAVAAAFALSMASSMGISILGLRLAMDLPWLEVVLERSQFLFLNYWGSSDWEIATRPFVCLTLTTLALDNERITRLCTRVMLVGLTGLIVAFAANAIAPVAVLLQGQAWRWMWVTSFVSVLLLLPTACRIWKDRSVGPLCATLLVLGWTCPVVDGLLCVNGALLLWLIRRRIVSRSSLHLLWTARILIVLTAAWVVFSCWSIMKSPVPFLGGESPSMARVREVFGLGVSAILILGPMAYCMSKRRSPKISATFGALFLVTSIVVLKGSLLEMGTLGTRSEIAQFEDWRKIIPPSATVLIVPTGKSAAFSWFTLGRPSYISVDQSAGVVFSRATAMEIRRRSEILLPLADPSWQILSNINRSRAERAASTAPPTVPSKPLTPMILVSVCGDIQLDFVIAQENVGFNPVVHRHRGAWKDWNLYDCRKVRVGVPSA